MGHAVTTSRTGSGTQAAPDVPRKRVLLAEDEESTRKLIAAHLRAMGLDVIEAGDGGRMLVAVTACYREGRSPADLDLVITDVHMPVIGGLEVLKGMRVAGWTTPVIVITGGEPSRMGDAAYRLGAVLLGKPLDLDAFERAVRNLLDLPRPARRRGAGFGAIDPSP